MISPNIKRPQLLSPGDTIAIVSPASAVKPEFIDSAADYLRSQGYQPLIMPHAKGRFDGNYSGSLSERLDDFIEAWQNPKVKALLCGRGGYGAVHLLPYIPAGFFATNPKWLIGFSDITALHCRLLHEGVESLHAPMAKDMDGQQGRLILDILETGRMPNYDFNHFHNDKLPPNRGGEAEGYLIGGNMAVFDGLMGTPFDLSAFARRHKSILFIEDIAEPPYKINRILWQLLLSGTFDHLKGLIVGQFTEYTEKRPYEMEWMINDFLIENNLTELPVRYGFPAGHVKNNQPLLMGSMIKI